MQSFTDKSLFYLKSVYMCSYVYMHISSCILLPSALKKNFLPSRQGKVTHLLSCISGALTAGFRDGRQVPTSPADEKD